MAVSRDEGRTEDFESVYWDILGGVTFAAVLFRFAFLAQERNSISLGASDFLWSHVLGVHRLCPCARETRDKNIAMQQSACIGKNALDTHKMLNKSPDL
jgi:hypothetical protein